MRTSNFVTQKMFLRVYLLEKISGAGAIGEEDFDLLVRERLGHVEEFLDFGFVGDLSFDARLDQPFGYGVGVFAFVERGDYSRSTL